MKIGYRRLAGKIKLGTDESGTRGAWWEKRRALMAALGARGHSVHIMSGPAECDLLLIEFGSSNEKFYGTDLATTRAVIELHAGPVAYVCDDPDLPLPKWDCAKRVRLWRNATRVWGEGGQSDVSFGALLPQLDPVPAEDQRWLYAGRPDGLRGRKVAEMLDAGAPLVVMGRADEWSKFGIRTVAPPPQPMRHSVYKQFVGMLGMSDAKHKRLGWRTGRVQHAVAAGIPALVEDGHPGFGNAYPKFGNAAEAVKMMTRYTDPVERMLLLESQRAAMRKDRVLLDEALEAMAS